MDALVRRLAELDKHLTGVRAARAATEAEIIALFDAAGTNRLRVEIGVLVRERAGDGAWRLRIELAG